ncbi:uncharacterized protein METZ01_LOCUS13727 [marine metagenome]|uniref:Uncharacterized protein n=1 Tax=marine metagenome TaxID=408172 RepID=A0A381P5G3_9ZZZZ
MTFLDSLLILIVPCGSVAQLVEHLTFNQVVRGSRPRRPTKDISYLIVTNKTDFI